MVCYEESLKTFEIIKSFIYLKKLISTRSYSLLGARGWVHFWAWNALGSYRLTLECMQSPAFCLLERFSHCPIHLLAPFLTTVSPLWICLELWVSSEAVVVLWSCMVASGHSCCMPCSPRHIGQHASDGHIGQHTHPRPRQQLVSPCTSLKFDSNPSFIGRVAQQNSQSLPHAAVQTAQVCLVAAQRHRCEDSHRHPTAPVLPPKKT